MSTIDKIRSLIFKESIPLLETYTGIGDILLCYIYANQLLNRFNKIQIRINYGYVFCFRNNNMYSEKLYNFTNGLASRVFSDPRFELVDTPLDTGPIQGHDYPELLGVRFKPTDISFILPDSNVSLGFPYLVINTKVRNYPKSENDSYFLNLLQYLNKFNGKIVLVGDRRIDYSMNLEYAGHENTMYSIYDQLINGLPSDNIVDLTHDLLMHEPNLDKFLHEYSLVRNATEVIQIGIGGSYLISMLLNSKTKVIIRENDWGWIARECLPNCNIFQNYQQLCRE